MPARLYLHIRRTPSGRVIATPVPLAWLSIDADTEEAARAAAVRAVREHIAENIEGSVRAMFAEETTAVLDSVRVGYGDAKEGARFEVALGLVVITRQTTDGPLHLAYAPEAPDVLVVVRDLGELHERARAVLAKAIADWGASEVLASEERGEVSLEALEVPFGTGGGGDEDSPSIQRAADDLTARAADGRLGRLDRRDPLVERALAALAAADGSASVMLVGPADVGKTALVGEIAARLQAGDVPPALRGRRLMRITADELVAGASYVNQWQGRARDLIEFSRDTGAIVVFGDPNAVIDAGKHRKSDHNLARMLRPHVEEGSLRLICETTGEGLAAARLYEPSFVEVFHRIDLPEPDADAAAEILRAAGRRLEANLAVELADDAVHAALELTRRFEPYRALPGKAVRLLEETAQLASAGGHMEPLRRDDVARAFARRTGMPLALLSDQVELRPRDVRSFLEQRVLGQDEAVAAMVDLVAVVKAGLNDPGKPLGTFLFVGPTGVGKTELTKALAEFLFGGRDRVLRFDMGEYAAADAVPRLVGSAWQRGDRADEGELTRRVREQPFSVVLLDEIEKAHPDAFDVLLSALGEGRLTDASGRTADLRNVIVVMTSNLGAGRGDAVGVGFGDSAAGAERDRRRRHFVAQAEQFFRPEFFNRIDSVIAFEALDRDTIRRIAGREVGRLLLREGITRRRLLVEIDEEVVGRLADAGFHPRYGARPLHREIERAVIRPLARLIVEQRPGPGDLIRLRAGENEIGFEVHRVREPRRPAPGPREAHAEATLARAAALAHELAERLRAQAEAPPAVPVRDELSRLVDAVNAPGFWDDPDAARGTLARVYQLQRLLDDLTSLRSRAEGLAELGNQLKARRQRARLGELRRALGEVEDRLELVRLELAGAAAGPEDLEAELTFTPVGSAADGWAGQLRAMYGAWAQRTGREARAAPGRPEVLVVSGAASHALLAGEAGLHRRDGAEGSRLLVRVTVQAPGRATRNENGDAGTVVRVYADGQRTGVRDPRTGATVGNLRAVLEAGRIDVFILAVLAAGADADAQAAARERA
jgi:ATP-dependent Clp protease ATP-binding subunit ClpC